jgi:hypothetical protein
MKLIRQDWQLVVTQAITHTQVTIDIYWDVTWELDGDTGYVRVFRNDDLAFRGTFKAGRPNATVEPIPHDEWPEAVREKVKEAVRLAKDIVAEMARKARKAARR